MIEIENLTKYCGLSAFRYWTYPPRRVDDLPDAEVSAGAGPVPDRAPSQPVPAAPAAALPRVDPRVEPARPVPPPLPAAPAAAAPRVEPRRQPATPAPLSVLGEVAAVLPTAGSLPDAAPKPAQSEPNLAPDRARSGRSRRTVRSAWRAVATAPPPR